MSTDTPTSEDAAGFPPQDLPSGTQDSNSRFLSLPAELRYMIYAYTTPSPFEHPSNSGGYGLYFTNREIQSEMLAYNRGSISPELDQWIARLNSRHQQKPNLPRVSRVTYTTFGIPDTLTLEIQIPAGYLWREKWEAKDVCECEFLHRGAPRCGGTTEEKEACLEAVRAAIALNIRQVCVKCAGRTSDGQYFLDLHTGQILNGVFFGPLRVGTVNCKAVTFTIGDVDGEEGEDEEDGEDQEEWEDAEEWGDQEEGSNLIPTAVYEDAVVEENTTLHFKVTNLENDLGRRVSRTFAFKAKFGGERGRNTLTRSLPMVGLMFW
ncbi:hypothetical protein DM02DRAFT_629504 [Periconia macrospinosa]|uniref:Uncharacterized protein n=1 Tax=Periconia macrospinosa TaxID=97972 RepID=A0A2V1DML8_9PLEO|nr:hypothetical protein DM02DRAFT_629504 [Periconia macrospinosa]